MAIPAYTQAQLMVAAAAREINDGDVVFVGMRLPLLGFQLAKSTHAPQAVGVYELGVVRETAVPEPILTMGDLPNLYHANWLADTADLMGLLQQGWVDVSFIGGAQVDRFGNLNTSYIGQPPPTSTPSSPQFPPPPPSDGTQGNLGEQMRPRFTRLPGSGGACDLASLAKRHIIIMKHEKRRFVEKVDYITSPGYGIGGRWRQQVGLPRGGPATVITTLAVLRFDPKTKEMILASVHPGITVAEVRANTGWDLRVADEVTETPIPTAAELNILRRFDPQGFWTS